MSGPATETGQTTAMSGGATAKPVRAIRMAVLAMGGEGGGVLANWLIDLAEANGSIAQMTSVAGVAQRTGATLYYIEMFPLAALKPGQMPVLAQMPTPGDVDIVVASELMEAGRAIQRGIVTPDRTTLIASSHRVFAMTERLAMSDGRVDAEALMSACRSAAQTFIAFDMMAMAERSSSIISAAMFGAIAGAKVLPFPREAFEQTITAGGIGVKGSLEAFAAACAASAEGTATLGSVAEEPADAPRTYGSDALVTAFPAEAREIVRAGVDQCRDWQDEGYARRYLERLGAIVDIDRMRGDGNYALTSETARQLALAMTYEDTIRVADLKIRASRFKRVEQEVGLKDGQILEVREYLHPRVQEIAETVPAPLGRFILRATPVRRVLEWMTADGKTIETTSVRGFATLYVLAGLRRWRRSNMRDAAEQKSIDAWLELVGNTARRDYRLAVEAATLRTLVKGYSDTHARGYANFDRIAALVPRLSGANAAQALASLRTAALADESGEALSKTLQSSGLA